jgi:sialidase-1
MLPPTVGSAQESPPDETFITSVFSAGQGDIHTYRIPSLIVAPSGALLAFAEARKNNDNDHGELSVVVRRSEDNGATWGPILPVAGDGPHAVQNPTAVVDRSTGRIWLCLIRTDTVKYPTQKSIRASTDQARRVWMLHSDDEGLSWSAPRDITESVCPPDRLACIPGPGVGIQLSSDRLLIPSHYREFTTGEVFGFSIYSDDSGESWHPGSSTGPKVDENQAVELEDGSVLLNIRSERQRGLRSIALSRDGGLTWSPVEDDPNLIEPVCQASIVRYTKQPESDRNRILFSNPARKTFDDRNELTVRISYDEGKSWSHSRVLNAGFSAYSCLAVLPDGSIGCLFERQVEREYDDIAFARFSLEWLTDGKDSLSP